jgi:epoxyqueuosine reductase
LIPRTTFQIAESIEDLYKIEETTYKRFDSSRTAFVRIGKQDTSEIGPLYFLDKMMQKAMDNIQKNVFGKSRLDYALQMGSNAVNLILGAYGDQNANKQFLKWASLFVPEPLTKWPAQIKPSKLTSLVKGAAMTYGAALVGIAELDRRWVYDRNIYKPFIFDDVEQPVETEGGFVIPNSVNKAVVMIIPMNKGLILESPGVGNETSTELAYSAMGCLSVSLAEFIRALGYNAIPCMNDTALSIPLAISAGLGQLGRLGLLITPEYGPCVRICKVLTDMPLNADKPVDFRVTEFCDQCLLCAKACPVDAITFGDRTFSGLTEGNNPGAKKWYVNVDKCLRFWQANGTSCSNCIAACPFTVGFSFEHCLQCVKCIAPDCPLQSFTHKRLQYGY